MNKKKIRGIDGFEELFENYLDQDEYAAAKKEQELKRDTDQYELQHFLEQENIRLGNIETFLTKKIPAKTNFSQAEKLIAHQRNRKKEVMQKILPVISKLTSSFQQNMAQLFNAHFD